MRLLLAVALATLALAPAASAQDPVASGSFAQLAGEAGCMVQSGALTDGIYAPGESSLEGCDKGRGLFSAHGVTLSPDGLNVYVASSGTRRSGSNAVVTLARAADTGRLSFTECVSDDGGDGRVGTDGLCGNGDALLGANAVAISADGRYAYVASAGSNGVAWFARNAAGGGRLTQLGCVKEVPRADRCLQGRGLFGASGLALSPDGRHLYVSSRVSDAVATFTVDPETGAIAQTGCVSANGTDGLCDDGTALTGASSVRVSADGLHVYVTADEVGAVTWFARDAGTGLLTQKGCLIEDAVPGGACATAKSLAGAQDAVLTPDDRQVLVAGRSAGTLSVLTRDAATGGLTPAGCLQHREPTGDEVILDPEEEEFEEELDAEEEEEDEAPAEEEEEPEEEEEEEVDDDPLLAGCTAAKALGGASDVAVSADGRAAFVTGAGYVAVFQRDPLTGNLTQTACAENYRTYKSCTEARGIVSFGGLAASGDGRNLYFAGGGAVSTFGASTAVATPAARIARDGRAAFRLVCPAARTATCRGRVAVASRRPARGHAFRLAPGRARAVRVKVPLRIRRAVRRNARARVTLVLRDATRRTRLSGRRVTLNR